MRDFFVSYNHRDRVWAEWIAWTLEEKGHTAVIQAWDFRPGGLVGRLLLTPAKRLRWLEEKEIPDSHRWTAVLPPRAAPAPAEQIGLTAGYNSCNAST